MEYILKKKNFNFFIYTMTKIHAKYQASPILLTDLILVNKKKLKYNIFRIKNVCTQSFFIKSLNEFFFGFSIET
jgi:hypothetical protein